MKSSTAFFAAACWMGASGAFAQEHVTQARASFIFNGERVKISRDTAQAVRHAADFASSDETCGAPCIAPMEVAPGVPTLGETEVLAGIYAVEAREEGDSKRLVLRAINAGLTSQTMAHLLKDAARDGLIDVPASLNTSDGDLDMDTLIFNLVQTSLAADGTPEGAKAAREMSRRAFAASDVQTRQVDGARVYTVEAGDSLAYISLQFNGRPGAYDRIFQANRSILTSPDKIQIGQRLIIPG